MPPSKRGPGVNQRQPQKKFVALSRQPNTVRGGPEKKAVETVQALNVPIAGTAVVSSSLTIIPQGATSNDRLGRKTRLTKLNLRWQASLVSTSLGGSPLRIKVVYDKQANGVAPLATDVLLTDLFYGPNNLDNADRFISLIDEITEPLSVNNNFSIGGQFNRQIDLEQMWLGTTASGAITSLLTGSVYMFVWQTGAITTTPPVFSYYTRVRFEDN